MKYKNGFKIYDDCFPNAPEIEYNCKTCYKMEMDSDCQECPLVKECTDYNTNYEYVHPDIKIPEKLKERKEN